MPGDIEELVTELVASRHFEDASLATLQAMLHVADAALGKSPYAKHGRILRACIHVRPRDVYRRLFSLSREAARSPNAALSAMGAGDPGDLQASHTAWRSVVEHRCPVSIDVNVGSVRRHLPDGAAALEQASELRGAFHAGESRQRYLGRQASHLFILPLLAPGGAVEGMVILEAECLPAVGEEFVWPECADRLLLLVGAAAPYVLGLRLRPATSPTVDEFLPVIGSAMASMLPILSVFAQQDETILVRGPTGSGKSRLARWCHERSPRRRHPLEILDLQTCPEDLQMAELFGWKRGAFSGAVGDNQGAVARAESGTLFIDEVDKLSLRAQAGLLYFLEERKYRALGDGGKERQANVRFIVGTNVDLFAAVEAGQFREDLYYRINVLPILMPALEERQDEIGQWANFMVARRHRERHPAGMARLAPDAERRLSSARWPGNLRQLDNIIRRAYTLAIAERGVAADEVVLEDAHVAQALGYEARPAKPAALGSALQAAALEFLRAAQRSSSGFDLDLAEAFRGYVLAIAIEKLGRDEAWRLLGREGLLKNRNHQKALRRELERVEILLRAAGEPVPAFVSVPEDGEG